MTTDINVILAGGTYQLASTLSFSALDSGNNGHQVIWQAAAGSRPQISGGVPITGWAVSSSYPNLWSAPAPAGLATRQLYANGNRLPRAIGKLGAGALSGVGLTFSSAGYTASNSTFDTWKNPSAIEFNFADGHGPWSEPRCDVASVSGATITMRQPCWDNMQLPSTPLAPDGFTPTGGFPSLGSALPSSIENAFELLTAGHWYLDSAANTMYYYPLPADTIGSMSFIAPVLQQLMTSTSTADNPLHDVTFQGIEFAHTTWLQPSGNDGFSEMQANMTVTGPGGSLKQGLCSYSSAGALEGTCPFGAWTRPPAAVDLTGTKRVSFLSNVFIHLGGAGLGFLHGANSNLIRGNEVTDVSSNGIQLGGTDDPQPTAFATTNLALNKVALQSSTSYGASASRAVDGNTDGAFSQGSITHTDSQKHAWWSVDLGASQPLWNMKLFNRSDCCGGRDTDYWVFVSATPFNTALTPAQQETQPGVWSSHQRGQMETPSTIPSDTTGRYVMVQLAGTNHLSLAEVQIFSGAEIATNNSISNNYVHSIGAEFTAAVGIFVGYTRGTTVAHNQLSDLPYSGINIGWGGWHTNTALPYANPNINGGNVVTANLVRNIMLSRQDGGAVYSNGSQGTSFSNGLTISGNATFANPRINSTFYTDAGSSFVSIDGNMQFDGGGSFNGGAVTMGPVNNTNNYHANGFHGYGGANTGDPSLFTTGSGNVQIAQNPAVGVIPASILAPAGLESAYRSLTTQYVPVLNLVSPISDGTVLLSGSGFTPSSTVSVSGLTSPSVSFISSTFLTATIPSGARSGPVTVTTAAGTSAVTASSVVSTEVSLATGKAATQSSTALGAVASRAVDGQTDGNLQFGSVTHTGLDASPWWQVDLGSSQQLGSIAVSNRTDYNRERLTDYWVFASATPFDTGLTPAQQSTQPGVWSNHQTIQAGSPTTLAAQVTARYIMVQLSGTDYLTLAEVQVFSPPIGASGSLTTGKTATQSSTAWGASASRAADGQTDGLYWSGSVSHTNLESSPWWQVDLGSRQPLGSISVFNRTDGNPERLTDYWVFASATPFAAGLTPTQQSASAGVWSSHQTTQAGSPTNITAPVTARYIMVQLSGTNYLSLAEVQAFTP